MIAIAKCASVRSSSTPDGQKHVPTRHEQFLSLLPAIRRRAQIRFQFLDEEAREEMVAAVVAHAWVFFVKLVSLGRESLAFAGPLARYGVARILDGRQVGNQVNVHDVTSQWCQSRKGVCVKSLVQRDPMNGEWQEILVEDRTASPADIAAMRIDFQDWLDQLPRQQRLIAEVLATGEQTKAVSRMFHISAGRVSQVRGELQDSWRALQRE